MPRRIYVPTLQKVSVQSVFHSTLPKTCNTRLMAPLGLVDLWQLLKLNRPALKDAPFKGYIIPELASGKSIFTEIAAKDFSLYHPYDSFDMIVNLFENAATDPDVSDIYITLYRIDPNSPIVAALKKAASNGKSGDCLDRTEGEIR